MVTIKVDIPKNLHDEMAQHPEIKWKDVIQQSIAKVLAELEEIDEISSDQLRAQLNLPIEEITDEDLAFAEKMG